MSSATSHELKVTSLQPSNSFDRYLTPEVHVNSLKLVPNDLWVVIRSYTVSVRRFDSSRGLLRKDK